MAVVAQHSHNIAKRIQNTDKRFVVRYLAISLYTCMNHIVVYSVCMLQSKTLPPRERVRRGDKTGDCRLPLCQRRVTLPTIQSGVAHVCRMCSGRDCDLRLYMYVCTYVLYVFSVCCGLQLMMVVGFWDAIHSHKVAC